MIEFPSGPAVYYVTEDQQRGYSPIVYELSQDGGNPSIEGRDKAVARALLTYALEQLDGEGSK